MTKRGEPGTLTLIEWDAGRGDLHETNPCGAEVIVQGKNESVLTLLDRAEECTRTLRMAERRVTSIRVLLGRNDPARSTERIQLACGLSHLLADRSNLHFIATDTTGPRMNWLEFIGWLLGDSRWSLETQVEFHDQVDRHRATTPIPPRQGWAAG